MRLFKTFSLLALFCALAFAEGTRTWEQSKFEDLSKGTTNGVAIRSVGALELAPTFKMLYATPSTYLWSIASEGAGVLYAAAGAPARVYRITADGQATTIFEPAELQVQALVVDKSGAVYASTAPDGKVYKIEHKGSANGGGKNPDRAKGQVDPAWSSSVYFDPETKYIWDLVLDNAGNLYVPRAIRDRSSRSRPRANTPCFSRAMKSTSACSRLTRRAI
jgi:hypothetical protein